jgi:hypothetical protein
MTNVGPNTAISRTPPTIRDPIIPLMAGLRYLEKRRIPDIKRVVLLPD